MEKRGAQLKRVGKELTCLCPLHADRNASFRINVEKNTWFCDPCGVGGSVIDLVQKIDGISVGEAMRKLGGDEAAQPRPSPAPKNGTGAKIVATYDYHDEKGEVVYQVVRLEPKDFRQRKKTADGWSWSMEGVRRVLYNLPAVLKSEFVWIVEGEKDADALIEMGLCATCNPGGAGKWLESYSESLRGKEIVLCGDNDDAGRRHVEKVKTETAGIVKTSRVMVVPQDFKDVSDFIQSFTTKKQAANGIVTIAEKAEVFIRGVSVPVRSMSELEREYAAFATRTDQVCLKLGAWIPSLGYAVRPLVAGELAVFVADTGVGKTMLLQNLALHTRLTTLMFEIELPNTLTFERFAAMATKSSGGHVFDSYSGSGSVAWKSTGKLDHIHVCGESRLAPMDIERIINQAGLKIGHTPSLVMLDYIQLVRGSGSSRYDRMSSVAEELKVIAKSTGTIIVIASQIHRKGDDDAGEVFLHDAKDSGSIENSAGLVIGAWRDADDKERLWLKVMKNTKGSGGKKIPCRILGSSLVITEEEPSRRQN